MLALPRDVQNRVRSELPLLCGLYELTSRMHLKHSREYQLEHLTRICARLDAKRQTELLFAGLLEAVAHFSDGYFDRRGVQTAFNQFGFSFIWGCASAWSQRTLEFFRSLRRSARAFAARVQHPSLIGRTDTVCRSVQRAIQSDHEDLAPKGKTATVCARLLERDLNPGDVRAAEVVALLSVVSVAGNQSKWQRAYDGEAAIHDRDSAIRVIRGLEIPATACTTSKLLALIREALPERLRYTMDQSQLRQDRSSNLMPSIREKKAAHDRAVARSNLDYTSAWLNHQDSTSVRILAHDLGLDSVGTKRQVVERLMTHKRFYGGDDVSRPKKRARKKKN